MKTRRLVLVAAVLAFAACGPAQPKTKPLPPLSIPAGCNPLAADWDCMLPYPSDFYLKDDASTPSGKHVVVPDNVTIQTSLGTPVNFTRDHPADGFSIEPQIDVLFPQGVDDSNLPFLTGPNDITTSLDATSPTVIIEAKTGKRILHLAEIDPRTTDPKEQAFIIRPLERLQESTRYIVAIRDLKDTSGKAIPAPEGFRRIRDGVTAGDPILDPIAKRYEKDIFPALKKAGIDRSSLQLAWDFTTESRKSITGDMFKMRELLVQALTTTPPAVTITKVNDAVSDGHTFRRIDGTIEVPLYMSADAAGSTINRDANGEVAQNGTAKVPFLMMIPNSVATDIQNGGSPGRIIQYGHGFFGSRTEAAGGYPTSFADQVHAVLVAVDWQGMSTADAVTTGGNILSDFDASFDFSERVVQGMANFIALTYAVDTTMTTQADMMINGTLVYDPTHIYYYGISQGSILGGTYLALAPKIDRAALSVGGDCFPLMMFRAVPFKDFLSIITQRVSDPLALRKMVSLSSTVFDHFDPITYAPWVLKGRTSDDPSVRYVLSQTGIGDTEVPNVAEHLQARAIGLTHLLPAPRPIPALPEAEGPLDDAEVEFDFGIAKPLPGTYSEIAGSNNQVHEGVRRLPEAIAQIDAFLKPGGKITNTCSGPCDPH